MEKKQYELCIEVLKRLDKAGVLENIIIIGSWCLPFYEDYFQQPGYGPTLRTRDIDFLIPHGAKFKKKVDLPGLLEDLGFVVGFLGNEGYIRLEHPDLAIEFLVAEKGRGSHKPFKIPQLGVNAQPLRYLQVLNQDIVMIKKEGMCVTLPHPAFFAFHKLIIAQLRTKKDKREKDKNEAVQVLRAILKKEGEGVVLKCFKLIFSRWQSQIVKSLKSMEENELLGIIKK